MPVMETDVLTEVMRLRNRGLSVFPVSIDTKKPIVAWDRLQDELPNEEDVTKWFGKGDCAVGIATGPVSDIFLLDFDFAKHPEARQFYEGNLHRLPRTWTEETGSGGLHFYFRWDEALDVKKTNTTSILHLGVDTKGYGGYSKVTPSPGYKWLIPPHMAALAMCPQWLIDALPNKERREIVDGFKQKPDGWMVRELENVDPANPINGRTPTFVRAIGRLKAKGLDELEVKGLLAPWAQKYEYLKLDSLVEDQFHRYPPKPGVAPVFGDQSVDIETFLSDHTPVKWVCEPFIAENTIGFIAGLPESRKSWVMVDLAVEVARGGGSWLNKFPVNGGKVLLIDQERGKKEIQRRIKAVLAGKGLNAGSIRHSLRVRSTTSTRIDLQNSFDSLKKEMGEFQPNLLLVDSFATFHTKNESNRMEIQQVMERIKELRNEFKCAIVFIHHETKQSYQNRSEGAESSYLDMAGNVAIPAAAEFCMNIVKRDDDSSFCHHTKSTEGQKAAPFLVKVRDVAPNGEQIVVEAY